MNDSNISHENAQESLDAVQKTMVQTRKAIASTETAFLLMLWGLIWIGAYIVTHFLCLMGKIHWIAWVWYLFCGAGSVASYLVCWRQSRSGIPIKTPTEKKIGQRIFLFWLFLFIFAFIWIAIMAPVTISGIQINAFIVTLIMFAYVVSGLWRGGAYMVWLGLTVTAVTVIGYFLIPPTYYSLWMAPTAGGSLFVTGLYIRLRWK